MKPSCDKMISKCFKFMFLSVSLANSWYLLNRSTHLKLVYFAARWQRYLQNSSALLACECLSLSHLAAIYRTKREVIYWQEWEFPLERRSKNCWWCFFSVAFKINAQVIAQKALIHVCTSKFRMAIVKFSSLIPISWLALMNVKKFFFWWTPSISRIFLKIMLNCRPKKSSGPNGRAIRFHPRRHCRGQSVRGHRNRPRGRRSICQRISAQRGPRGRGRPPIIR